MKKMDAVPLHRELSDPGLHSALAGYVRRRIGQASDADDVIQSTLADALGSEHAPGSAEDVRRWVFGIARNKVADHFRRRGREPLAEIDDLADPGQEPEHEERDLLRWAEREVPPGEQNQRTFEWLLREGHGDRLEEIADDERLPAPAVRQRVSRLRRYLRSRWAAAVAATLAVAGLYWWGTRPRVETPIARETPGPVERASELRRVARRDCAEQRWQECVAGLDRAKALDPTGDDAPDVAELRAGAARATSVPAPAPSAPAPSAAPPTVPVPTALPKSSEAPPRKPVGKPALTSDSMGEKWSSRASASTSVSPSDPPKAKAQGKKGSFDSDSNFAK